MSRNASVNSNDDRNAHSLSVRMRFALMAAVLGATWLASAASPAKAAPILTAPAAPSQIVRTIENTDGNAPPPVGLCLGYGAAVWVETSYSPQQWSLEQFGEFCPVKVDYTCTGSQGYCEFEYWLHHAVAVRANTNIAACAKLCVIQPIGPGGAVVLASTAKGYIAAAEFSLPASSGLGIVSTGYSPASQTVYASVTNPAGAAGILTYAFTSSSPTGSLTDPAAGPNAGGITTDKKGNVYWAFDDASNVGHIDEFVGGGGTARRLPANFKGEAGDIGIDKKGNLVVSDPTAQTITVYSQKGKPVAQFAVTGMPGPFSLDAKNANLYVVDMTNNVIDQYSYPGGTLISQIAAPSIGSMPAMFADVTAPTPELP
jgi:hypothetical protein